MVKFMDLTIFFKPCSTINGSGHLLSNRCPTMDPLNYFKPLFKSLPPKSNSLYAATITIGNIKYGSMSADKQYADIVKTIKNTYSYHGETKYVFYFEFQKNGNLHAHGAIYNGYQSKFSDSFNKYGLRNIHDKSYEPIKTIEYFEYICKDKEKIKYKPIHNIKKSDVTASPQVTL